MGNYLEKIGLLAKEISEISIETQRDYFALFYGFVLMGELAKYAKQMETNIDERCRRVFLKNITGETTGTLNIVLPRIRDVLVHHFHRLDENTFSKFFSLFVNGDLKYLARLSNIPDKKPEENEKNYQHRSDECIYLLSMTNALLEREKIAVANIVKFKTIIVCFENIETLMRKDPQLGEKKNEMAINMMVIIAGNCANELKKGLKDYSFNQKEDVLDILELLYQYRTGFAHPHYSDALSTPKSKELILNIRDDLFQFMKKLKSSVSAISSALNQDYEKAILNFPNPEMLLLKEPSSTSSEDREYARFLAEIDSIESRPSSSEKSLEGTSFQRSKPHQSMLDTKKRSYSPTEENPSDDKQSATKPTEQPTPSLK